MKSYSEVCVDVFGDWAVFTNPAFKVERDTYLYPTPSACRGVLNAIYCKPKEFYYQITKIEIMSPIRTIQQQRNEVTVKANSNQVLKDGYFINPREPGKRNNTQRMTTYLVDVYYRIHANIVMQPNAPANINIRSLVSQFNRRVSQGKCFYQPYFGQTGCMCFFEEPNLDMQPLDINDDYGPMLYDVFDITQDNSERTLDTRKNHAHNCTKVTMFHCKVEHGIINVPLWGSKEIIPVY